MVQLVSNQIDWLIDVQFERYKDGNLPEPEDVLSKANNLTGQLVTDFIINDNTSRSVLPMLRISILRLVYWTLFYNTKTESNLFPNSVLHKLNEELFKSIEGCQNFRSEEKFCFSNEPIERLLALLVLIRTCNDTYRIIKAANLIKKELNNAELRAIFVNIRGPLYISNLLCTHRQAEFSAIMEVYVQVSLDSALDQTYCLPTVVDEIIVEKLLKVLQETVPEPQVLEKLMVVMQRICKLRNLKKLCDQKNLTPHLQQLWLKSNTDNAFLALSVRSVLSSVGATIPILK